MKQRKRHNWLRRIALGLAISAIVVPGVGANAAITSPIESTSRPAPRELDARARPGAFDSGIPGGGYVPANSAPPPGVFDSGVPGGGYVPESNAPIVTPAEPGGVDWPTVAVGLGAGLAGLLAGAAAALATRRRQTPTGA